MNKRDSREEWTKQQSVISRYAVKRATLEVEANMGKFLNSMNIPVSGLMAQRLRMDIIAQNVANAETTRTQEGGPYRRQQVMFIENRPWKNIDTEEYRREVIGGGHVFGKILDKTLAERTEKRLSGVNVEAIVEDRAPFKPVYDPTHPDADENGYVYMPNVDVAEEQMDLIAATNSYNANLAVFDTMVTMAKAALSIGQ